MTEVLNIKDIQESVSKELSVAEVSNTLLATTFKGLSTESMKKAMVEGMIRGFTFKDFLEKNVYAVPFGQAYSLVTSIDYSRKVGMRSGIVGSSEPTYEEKDGKIVTCSMTVKRAVGNVVGDFTAKVYFDEYTTGKNLWASKPRTMIAKVAEMHALRKACPEEMSQLYVGEEMDKDTIATFPAGQDKKTQPASEKGKIIYLLKRLGKDTSTKESTLEAIKALTDVEVTEDPVILGEIVEKLEILVTELHNSTQDENN